jgi:5'-3' exonuclease
MVMFPLITCSIDLEDSDTISFYFPLGTPFSPYEQLMGVFPLASKNNIPSAYHVHIFLALFNPSIDSLEMNTLSLDLIN